MRPRLLALVLLAAAPAVAGDAMDEYRAKFAEGMAHFQERRFAQAIDHWEPIAEALGDEKAFRLLYNLGVASLELGRTTRGADYLERFLRELSKKAEGEVGADVRAYEADAKARLGRAKETHARLRVLARGEAMRIAVSGEDRTADRGRDLYLVPGKHVVVLRSGSPHEETREVDLGAGALVELEPRALPAPPVSTRLVVVSSVVSVSAPPPTVLRPKVPAWTFGVTGGLAALSFALPIALRAKAESTRRSYEERETTVPERRALADRYERERRLYDASWAVPATLLVASGVLGGLHFYGPKERITVTAGPGGASVRGTF